MMIKNFSQYLIEEEREVYFTFGRMNPPTIGHGKVMDTLSTKSGKADYKVYVSQQSNPKKDPLSYSDKVKHIRKMFPKHARNVMIDKNIKNVFDVASRLYDQGYKRITMVVGEDRIREFDVLLNKYNGVKARHGFYNFENINVVSAGKRDPDAEGVEGMSASKQRENAKNNDFVTFAQGVPKTMSDKDARKLFNDVRKGMGLKEERSFKNHIELMPVSETREQYVQGELYGLGDTVVIKETEEVGTVSLLGANYVIVERSDGTRLRKWLDAIELVERQDPDIKDREGTQPARYHSGLKKSTKVSRDAHFKKHGKKADDDDSAYKPAPGDKTAKTKPSKYTKQFKDMFDENVTKQVKEEMEITFEGIFARSDGSPETTAQMISRWASRTTKKKQYDQVAKYIRKEMEKDKGKKHSAEYHSAEAIRKFNLKGFDDRALAQIVRSEQTEETDPVKSAQDSIAREKEQDKKKHDKILDRARLARAKQKNRETK